MDASCLSKHSQYLDSRFRWKWRKINQCFLETRSNSKPLYGRVCKVQPSKILQSHRVRCWDRQERLHLLTQLTLLWLHKDSRIHKHILKGKFVHNLALPSASSYRQIRDKQDVWLNPSRLLSSGTASKCIHYPNPRKKATVWGILKAKDCS